MDLYVEVVIWLQPYFFVLLVCQFFLYTVLLLFSILPGRHAEA